MGLTPERWARVRVVSWDVDGTLYAMGDLRRALRRRALAHLLRLRWASVARAAWAMRRQRAVLAAARAGRLDPSLWADPWYRELVDDWLVPAVASAGPRPEALAALDAVAASGRRRVVLSDLEAGPKLAALGLEGRFERAFAGQDLGVVKPHPALFRHVLDTLALEPAEMLHVGDRADTDGGAEALGIPFLHVHDLPALTALVAP